MSSLEQDLVCASSLKTPSRGIRLGWQLGCFPDKWTTPPPPTHTHTRASSPVIWVNHIDTRVGPIGDMALILAQAPGVPGDWVSGLLSVGLWVLGAGLELFNEGQLWGWPHRVVGPGPPCVLSEAPGGDKAADCLASSK